MLEHPQILDNHLIDELGAFVENQNARLRTARLKLHELVKAPPLADPLMRATREEEINALAESIGIHERELKILDPLISFAKFRQKKRSDAIKAREAVEEAADSAGTGSPPVV